jgi:hypothetical protein
MDRGGPIGPRCPRADGLIVGGTDAGGIGLPPPGFSLLRELEMLSIVMGPTKALRAVTYQAACYSAARPRIRERHKRPLERWNLAMMLRCTSDI